MLAFVTVLHVFFFVKLLRQSGSARWVFWVLTGIVGVYTHYFFVFVLLSEFATVLVIRRNSIDKHLLRNVVISGVMIGISLLPWLYYVYSLGLANNTQPALGAPTAGDLFDTYAQFIFGFQTPLINTLIVSLWPVVVLLAFFAMQRTKRKVPPEVTLFVFLAVIPVLSAFVISVTIRPFYLSRYLIVSLPAVFIFVAWILTRYRRRVAIGVSSVLVIMVGLLFTVQAISPNTPVKEDYRQVVEYLDAHASASDVVVLAAPFTIYPVEYYYKGEARLTTQPIWNRFGPGGVPPYNAATVASETQQNVGAYQHAWLVLSYDQGYNDKLRDYYSDHYKKISEKKFSPGLIIYEYQTRYDKPVVIQ